MEYAEVRVIITAGYYWLFKINDHAALWISTKEKNVLYDPAGELYKPRHSDLFIGSKADITRYIKLHTNEGGTVQLFFKLPLHEANLIIENLEFNAPGEASPGSCALMVTAALKAAPSFSRIDTATPLTLKNQLEFLQKIWPHK